MQVPDRMLSAKRPFRFQKDLPTDKIRVNPLNPRKIFREKDINKLCDSILEMGGILVPLVVLEVKPDDFVLIDGQRRLIAAKKLKMETVPANIISGEMDDLRNLSTMFSIHMARESWDPASRAIALGILQKLSPDIPVERLEQITGMTRQNIVDSCRILSFPKDIVDRCLLEGERGYLRPANLVEMAKAIEVIDRYLPDFLEKHNREKVIRLLVEKRDNHIIVRNTEFRLIETMFSTFPAIKVKALMERLITEPETGITDIFESVEALISINTLPIFKKSCERFLEILKDFKLGTLDSRTRNQVASILTNIQDEIAAKKKALEAQ